MISPVRLFQDYRHCLFKCKRKSKHFEHVLFNKIWVHDKILGSSPVKAGLPWMTYNAIFFLNKALSGKKSVLETGSGGSTIFFLERCQSLTTMEHDENWLKLLQKDTRIKKSFHKWKPICARLESEEKDVIDESPYLQSLRNLPNHSFHLISVDGRLRSQTLIIASQKVNPQGYILLDNSNRVDYSEGINFLEQNGWIKQNLNGMCFNYEWDSYSTLWQRP